MAGREAKALGVKVRAFSRPAQQGRPLMRMILTLFALGAAAYVISKGRKQPDRTAPRAAFAPDQPHNGASPVRDAGPDAMRDGVGRDWSPVDEASDQSFPASDPPATY